MDRRVTPPERVTSPTWGLLPPCKQVLNENVITRLKSACVLKTETNVWNVYLYLYLFIRHTITIITEKCQKKCSKKWRGGLKETIELMLIRPPQLQFFEDGIKITATDKK